MGTRSQGWAIAVLLLLLGTARVAAADAKSDVERAAKQAMENYDLMDYDAAKKALEKAIATLPGKKLDKDPLAAKLHVYLGITTFAGGDKEGALKAFVAAVKIDAKVQIEAAYKSPELVKMLEAAKAEVAGGGAPNGNGGGDADCASIKGIQFKEPDGGKTGVAQPIEIKLGTDVTPVKVAVMYRPEGAADFIEGKLSKSGGCKYTGSIPGSALKGAILHYYVAAFDSNGKPIAGAFAGSMRAPNILEITAGRGGGGGGDVEDPINKVKKGPTPGVGGNIVTGKKPAKVYIAVSGGTGFGYVTGVTEAGNDVQTCCIGNSLAVVTPELGFYATRQLSIGLAGRIGFPIGANVNPPNATHSTIAPAGVLRVRYALASSGEGLRVMGQIGGGVMRNTIKLEMQPGGGDTDIVAQGPLLLGAGIGFMKKLTNNFAFMADLSAIAGIAVVDKLGTARLNSGVGGDVSLGVAVGF
jgi:hypothetical protein